MSPKKYRWSRVYESAEEELIDFLATKNITAERHHLESYEIQDLSPSPDTVRIWSAEGAAIFDVNGQIFSLQPGDVLDLPPDMKCHITTSLSDYSWYMSSN